MNAKLKTYTKEIKMGENNLFSNFLPNELETNPKIEVEQSASKDTSKYHQLSLFDFVYETGEFIINETNISQVNELPNDIVKNIENEATQENLAQKSNFELTMGYGISNSNKNPLPKIDFYKTQSFDLGGTKTRAENNLKALELALTITKQNRYATQEEQEILAKYSGFGGRI